MREPSQLTRSPPAGIQAGADNLLVQCMAVERGDTLLIVTEPPQRSFYDPRVAEVVAERSRQLGVRTRVLEARLASGPDDVPTDVARAMRSADHILFLSRLGDQIRFSGEHGSGRKTISYTRDLDYLGSRFGCTPFHLFQGVHDRLLDLVRSARRYSVAAASGTDLIGEVGDDVQRSVVTPFAITCFPAVICPPLRCVNLTGRLVLERFLMSTSVNDYESSVLFLDEPVSLEIDRSRIVGFHGPKALANTVREHYLRVGERFGGDPMTVNSWHAGIYPATFHAGHWRDDVASWAEITFASPRYTHFHTCGVDPGNVATATFDATIRFDGATLWDAGRPVFLERPEMQALLVEHRVSSVVFKLRSDIGL